VGQIRKRTKKKFKDDDEDEYGKRKMKDER